MSEETRDSKGEIERRRGLKNRELRWMDGFCDREGKRAKKKKKSGGEAEKEQAAFPLQREPRFFSHALIQRQLATL